MGIADSDGASVHTRCGGRRGNGRAAQGMTVHLVTQLRPVHLGLDGLSKDNRLINGRHRCCLLHNCEGRGGRAAIVTHETDIGSGSTHVGVGRIARHGVVGAEGHVRALVHDDDVGRDGTAGISLVVDGGEGEVSAVGIGFLHNGQFAVAGHHLIVVAHVGRTAHDGGSRGINATGIDTHVPLVAGQRHAAECMAVQQAVDGDEGAEVSSRRLRAAGIIGDGLLLGSDGHTTLRDGEVGCGASAVVALEGDGHRGFGRFSTGIHIIAIGHIVVCAVGQRLAVVLHNHGGLIGCSLVGETVATVKVDSEGRFTIGLA